MDCTMVYAPGFIHYRHGQYQTTLTGAWAALYRAMVRCDGDAMASKVLWSLFDDPEWSLDQISKSGYQSPQVTAFIPSRGKHI